MPLRLLHTALAFLLGAALIGCADGPGFRPLFNGVDLTGWVVVNGAPSTWQVRDSMIVCSGIPTGVMRSTEHYENFVLELEWRHVHPGGNAGLFVYSDALPVRGKPFTRAIECQIMDGNHGDVFAIQGATMTPDRPHPEGWMRCLPSEERALPAGEWNHYRVESRSGGVTLAVNGAVVSGGSESVPRRGYIVLESEGSEVHFRNIRIRELPSSNPPADEVATLAEGYRALYTGVDLDGWQAGPEHLSRWTPDDWRLATDGDPAPGPLWSTEAFTDFGLILDWRYTTPSTTADPTAGAATLLLRGSDAYHIPLPRPLSEPDAWSRLQLTLAGDTLTITRNDEVTVDAAVVSALPATGPIGLLGGGAAMEFANIYVKPLP